MELIELTQPRGSVNRSEWQRSQRIKCFGVSHHTVVRGAPQMWRPNQEPYLRTVHLLDGNAKFFLQFPLGDKATRHDDASR